MFDKMQLAVVLELLLDGNCLTKSVLLPQLVIRPRKEQFSSTAIVNTCRIDSW